MKMFRMFKGMKFKQYGLMDILGEVFVLIGTIISSISLVKREKLEEAH